MATAHRGDDRSTHAMRMRQRLVAPFLVLCYGAAVAFAASPPIHVINLDRNMARWDAVTTDLSSKGVRPWQICRLPAVDGKALSTEDLASNVTALSRWFCTPGMIGCYLSHKEFWKRTLASSRPWQIVLEDDVIVCPHFLGQVKAMVNEIQLCDDTRDKWDVLLIGAFGCIHPNGRHGFNRINALVAGNTRRRRRVTRHTHVPYRPFGTHAYVLSKRGAAKLLQNAGIATGHCDAVIWGIRDLFVLCCDPLLAHQDMDSASTIGGVTGGLETWMPKVKVDDYTNVTVVWALNEPLIRIPGLGLILTIGRALNWTWMGFALAIFLRQSFPWLLPLHAICVCALAVFLRIINSASKR